jgi:hypothetical protein
MNRRQLRKLGVPDNCVKSAVTAIEAAIKAGVKLKQAKQTIAKG